MQLSNNSNINTSLPIQIFVAVSSIAVIALIVKNHEIVKEKLLRSIRPFFVAIFISMGFIGNSIEDLIQNDAKIKITMDAAMKALKDSKIQDEIKAAVQNRLPLNIDILRSFQNQLPSRQIQAKSTQLSSDNNPITSSVVALRRSLRYFQYAAAAYGPEMMASLHFDGGKFDKGFDMPKRLSVITKNIDMIQNEDILAFDIDRGESSDYLRHLVVLDHQEKSIVMSIRGTITVSATVVDITAFSDSFCNGQAHSGMADMATKTWKKVESIIQKAMQEHPDYSLTITGHSLGAGVACLVTILVYHNKCFPKNRLVQCYAFAPPPVFTPLEAAPEAVNHTIAFCHHYDVVPSLSIDNFRRTLHVIATIDKHYSKNLSLVERGKFHARKMVPPSWVLEMVEKAINDPSEVRLVPGVSSLVIPSKVIIWMEQQQQNVDEDDLSYKTHFLDPVKFAKRIIHLNPTMMENHMLPKYHSALECLIKHQLESQEENK